MTDESAQRQTQEVADLLGESRVGVPGEDFDPVGVHHAYRLWGGHTFPAICGLEPPPPQRPVARAAHERNRKDLLLGEMLGGRVQASPRAGNSRTGPNRFRSAWPGSRPASRARRLSDFNRGCLEKPRIRNRFRRQPARRVPQEPVLARQTQDWKLLIIFCWRHVNCQPRGRAPGRPRRSKRGGQGRPAGPLPAAGRAADIPRFRGPSPTAVPPSRKNGTSLPSCAAQLEQRCQRQSPPRQHRAAPAEPQRRRWSRRPGRPRSGCAC